MRPKTVGQFVTVAFAGLALAACSSTPTSSTSESAEVPETAAASAAPTPTEADSATAELTNIWFVNPLPSYPAWGLSSKVFEDQAAALGYEATAVGPSKIDAAAMINMIDEAIADGAQGIITCNIDPKVFDATIKKAQDAGIVVVTIGCVDEASDYTVGTDNVAFGQAAADLIAEKVGAGAKVGVISTDKSTPNQVAQVESFKKQALDTGSGVEVVAWESGKGDTAIDAQKITAMLAANPDITAIWCVEGTCPGAAKTGLTEAGKKPGDLFFLGIDDVDTTLAGIEEGWVTASINQCWFIASAPLAVQLIQTKLAGKPSSQRTWSVPIDVITKDTLPYAGCPSDVVPTLS